MNAERFMELMNTLPDDMIVKAVHAEYRSRPKLIRFLPAIAACLVIGIFAAVYPKLRMQMPEVTEPPMMTAVTTAAVTTGAEQTSGTLTESAKVQTTEARTSLTRTQTTAAVNVDTTAVTAPEETAVQPTKTAPPDTEAPATEPALTECPAETTVFIQTTVEARTTEPQPVTIPIWKGDLPEPELFDPELPIDCKFSLCPANASNQIRQRFGIPAEYDLTQHQCLLVEIKTGYTWMAVHDGELTVKGLTLNIDWLNQFSANAHIYCAVPIPDDYTIEPENCFAEYLISEDEAEFLEMQIEKPMINIKE